tara:strand:- start:30 stop:701 length:672 start_codon:yes stop_codon:yes gene_type:complete
MEEIQNAFYETLNKEICSNTKNTYTDICLISKEKLTQGFVTLGCSHKFNYVTLFNELKHQKKSHTHLMNIRSKEEKNRFLYKQIICPYCRSVTNNLLPYKPELKLPRLIGINHSKPVCKYCFKSGKKKNTICNADISHSGKFSVCKPVQDTDEYNYCKTHLKIIEKRKEKLLNNSTDTETNNNELRCIGILKSGKRKGEQCGNRAMKGCNEPYCKKHIGVLFA